ncbi:MAG: GWxTD domain-containing protein [Gemmatimonadales bacterium]
MLAAAANPAWSAQSPVERATIDSFRTTLAADSDLTSVLGALTRTRAAAHAAKKDAVDRTELGWALLRAGQLLQSNDTLYAAADEFYHAIEMHRHWPYAWYGLGNVDLALEAAHAFVRPSVYQQPGAAWIQTAAIAFTEALKFEPSYVPAAVALARATLDNNFDPQTSTAVPLLRAVLDSTPGLVEPFLLLGRLEWRLDSLPQALGAFETYMRRGGDSAIGLLEVARTEYALDRPMAAESAYYAGAAFRDSAATTRYRQDLSYVADSLDLQAFDSATSGDLPGWLRRFWGERDAESGQPTGHRLAEHYRRYHYAMVHFHDWARVKKYEFMNVVRNNRTPFDDRGMVYIRHGLPDRIATYVPPPTNEPGKSDAQIPPNQSWLYFRPQGDLVLHFVGGEATSWKLVEDLASIAPIGASPDNTAELFESRMGFGPAYDRLAMLASMQVGRETLKRLAVFAGSDYTKNALGRADDFTKYDAGAELAKERFVSRSSLKVATTTDDDPINYPRHLEAILQVFGASSPEPNQARLLVEYALPDLDGVPTRTLPDSSVVYALRLRVQAADSSGRLILNSDSVRFIHAHRPLAKGQTLIGFALLDVPPAEYRVKAMISDTTGSTGAAWAISGIPAPALDGRTLTLSDPILGREGSGLSWNRLDGTIPLNPLNAYPKRSTAVLSYEVGGLTPGGSYTTRIAVRRFEADSAHNVISISFPSVASDPRELISKGLGLGNLDRGRYLLILTVSDGTQTVERTRRIVVGR